MMISNICQIAEDFGKSCGLMDFEIERIVRSRTDGKDERVVQLQFNDIDPLIDARLLLLMPNPKSHGCLKGYKLLETPLNVGAAPCMPFPAN